MRGPDPNSTAAHEHCWNLLPWFITGRLAADDAQRIERHLDLCAACRAELETQRELYEQVRRDEQVLLAPQASLQKLLARIDSQTPAHDMPDIQEIAATPPATPAKSRAVPRWLAIAAALQAVTIAFLLTLVWRQTADELTAPRYTTLTAPSTTESRGTTLRVVFKPDTSMTSLQSLLRAVNAQIIDGPTEAGVYTLRTDATDAADALRQVRADRAVVFAEDVSAGPRP